VADNGFRLGVDFGTSNTVAVLRWPDGRTKPLLFDGSPLLPAAVYLGRFHRHTRLAARRRRRFRRGPTPGSQPAGGPRPGRRSPGPLSRARSAPSWLCSSW